MLLLFDNLFVNLIAHDMQQSSSSTCFY